MDDYTMYKGLKSEHGLRISPPEIRRHLVKAQVGTPCIAMEREDGDDIYIVVACDDESINAYADQGFKKIEISKRERKAADKTDTDTDTGDDS